MSELRLLLLTPKTAGPRFASKSSFASRTALKALASRRETRVSSHLGSLRLTGSRACQYTNAAYDSLNAVAPGPSFEELTSKSAESLLAGYSLDQLWRQLSIHESSGALCRELFELKFALMKKEKRLEEALSWLDRSNHESVWPYRVDVLLSMNRIGDALKVLEAHSESRCFEYWYLRASCLDRMNRDADSLSCLEKAREHVKDQSQRCQALSLTSTILLKKPQLEQNSTSLQLTDEILSISPDCPEALITKSLIHQCQNESESALKAVNRLLRLPNLSPYHKFMAWIIRAKLDIQASRLKAAETHIKKALQFPAPTVDMLLSLVSVLYDTRKYELCLDCLSRVADLDPENLQLHQFRAWTLAALQRFPEALSALERVLSRSPDDLESRYIKAKIHFDLKQFDQAMSCYDSICTLDDQNPAAWLQKSFLHAYLEQWTEALQCFEVVNKLDPDQPLWAEKAQIFFQLEHFEEALDCLEKAIALTPQLGRLWAQKALAEWSLGRLKGAKESIQRAIEIDRNHPRWTEIEASIAQAADKR